MKGIKIDAGKQKLKEIDIEGTKDIPRILGCDRFAYGVRLDNGDSIFVDDEGLLKDPKIFFKTPDTDWLAGNGVLIGETENGELGRAKTTLEEAKIMIEFGSL